MTKYLKKYKIPKYDKIDCVEKIINYNHAGIYKECLLNELEYKIWNDSNVQNENYDKYDLDDVDVLTALMYYYGSLDKIELFCFFFNLRAKLLRKHEEGYTDFMECVLEDKDNYDEIEKLLKKNSFVLTEKTFNGITPLMMAVDVGKCRVVSLFLETYEKQIGCLERKEFDKAISIAINKYKVKCFNILINFAIGKMKVFDEYVISTDTLISMYNMVLRNGICDNEN